jgi:ABC-type transporter Mla subunit MlaD
VLVGLIGLVALAAVVLGMLWLVQFVLRNEEKGRD